MKKIHVKNVKYSSFSDLYCSISSDITYRLSFLTKLTVIPCVLYLLAPQQVLQILENDFCH